MLKSLPLFASLHEDWIEKLQNYLSPIEMEKLSASIEAEYAAYPEKVYPAHHNLFLALNLTSFESVKVVIVGQDPYHGPGQAHGLAFSVPSGVSIPPSLRNIFKEVRNDVCPDFSPSSGSLEGWAKQGVLLLNATLSVRDGAPLSHYGKGWESFTDAVLKALSRRPHPPLFVLWGNNAQKKCGFLAATVPPEFMLIAAHPSPLSASRGFFGCRHFSKINSLLSSQGHQPIQWA